MSKKLLNKYYIAKNTAIWSIIATVAMIIASVVLIIMEKEIQNISTDQYSWFQKNVPILKEACILITSIMMTTLLTTFLIEVHDRNKIFWEILGNDFITSQELYDAMTEQKRTELVSALENRLYFDEVNQKQEMHGSILKKMKKFPNDFYFQSCRYDVKCNIKNNIIEKTIVRTVRLRSYKKTHRIKNYILVRSGMRKIDGYDTFIMGAVKINGDTLSKKDILNLPYKKSTDISDVRANYENVFSVQCKNDIVIHSDRDTIVEIEYKTVVPISDTAFICRTSRPCKNFEVDFQVVKSDIDYKLSAHAFGFVDEAPTESMNHADKKRIKFDEWIFTDDGVIVYIEK